MNTFKMNISNANKFDFWRSLTLGFLLMSFLFLTSCGVDDINSVEDDMVAASQKSTSVEAESSSVEKEGPEAFIASGNPYSSGVNLQASYYSGGNPFVNWTLMKQYGKIKTIRIEVDPINGNYAGSPGSSTRNSDVRSKTRNLIKKANQNGLNVIVTYHNYKNNGSNDESALMEAADWWHANYNMLRGSGWYYSFHINLANEWGNNVNSTQYANSYNRAISRVRGVYAYNIIIDCPGYGAGTRRARAAYSNINDRNITYSVHVYPNSYNLDRGIRVDDINDLSNTVGASRCMIGEFGNVGSSDPNQNGTPWSDIVNRAKSLGWPVLGWCWNGDGGNMNMMSPSWSQNSNTTNVNAGSYFSVVYDKL